MILDLNILGIEEILVKFEQLKAAIQFKLATPALKLAAQPMLTTARAMAPVRTGILRDALILRPAHLKAQGLVRFQIGIRRIQMGAGKKNISPTRYAHLLEFGTVNMTPRAFLRPAFDQHKNSLIVEFGDHLWAGVEKHLAA